MLPIHSLGRIRNSTPSPIKVSAPVQPKPQQHGAYALLSDPSCCTKAGESTAWTKESSTDPSAAGKLRVPELPDHMPRKGLLHLESIALAWVVSDTFNYFWMVMFGWNASCYSMAIVSYFPWEVMPHASMNGGLPTMPASIVAAYVSRLQIQACRVRALCIGRIVMSHPVYHRYLE